MAQLSLKERENTQFDTCIVLQSTEDTFDKLNFLVLSTLYILFACNSNLFLWYNRFLIKGWGGLTYKPIKCI